LYAVSFERQKTKKCFFLSNEMEQKGRKKLKKEKGGAEGC